MDEINTTQMQLELFGMRTCQSCLKSKPIAAFRKNNHTCKACYAIDYKNRKQTKLRQSIEGFVYFIQADCPDQLIKIGFTRKSPQSRLNQLKSLSPVTLRLITHTRGTLLDEINTREDFAEQCHHGEWFYPCKELLEHIEEIKKLELYDEENS